MINLNDNNIEDGNMSAEGEGADSQGDSTAGRIPGESEGSGSSFAGVATGGKGQGNLDAICSYLVTIINLLNQLNYNIHFLYYISNNLINHVLYL